MDKPATHYCIGHKEKLTLDGEMWWHKIKEGKKTSYLCNKCIYCEGCKEHHPVAKYGGAIGRGNPTKYWCYKWAKGSSTSVEKKMQDLSPEEVMSGVQYGMDKIYEGNSNDWGKEHAEQVKTLKESL